MNLTYTKIEDLSRIVNDLQESFKSGSTKPLEHRREQLKQLWVMIDENEEDICDALWRDLHKSKFESSLGELIWVKQESHEAINNLKKWSESEYVKVGLSHQLNKCHIRKEPKGSWNYPINLLLVPLIGAIAAGCTAICKPSELAPNVAKLLAELFPKYLDQNCYRIVNGDAQVVSSLIQNHRFDHIFYTGSGTVGKIIMSAAAKQLTSVTLELGGKSPAIVADDANIEITAKRLIWGKTYNSGQTCISPDYIVCTRSTQEALIKEFPKAIEKFFGEDPSKSQYYCRMINQNHFDRVINVFNQTNGDVVIGGKYDKEDLYISPTVISNVSKDDKLMECEIFGPILPIMIVDDLDEAIDYINSKDIPLSLYIFTKNDKTSQYLTDKIRSGGVCINDCLMHFTVSTLPFGGLGPSGIGSYHGKKSFDTFTHERSVFASPYYLEKLMELRYPPYKDKNYKILHWIFFSDPKYKKNKPINGNFYTSWFKKALFILFVAYVANNFRFVNDLYDYGYKKIY
nr:2207_t:CDS:2 [Entrophospora candida]